MTRNQRRKLAAKRTEARTLALVAAARDARNAAIIGRNVGALRNGERFEQSGNLSPRAYRDYNAASGGGYVMGERRTLMPAAGFSRPVRNI